MNSTESQRRLNIALIGPPGHHTGGAVVARCLQHELQLLGHEAQYHAIFPGATSLISSLRNYLLSTAYQDCDLVVCTLTVVPRLPSDTPTVALVYDLRWRWTRGRWAKLYRSASLRRSELRRNTRLMPISFTVQTQLATHLGRAPTWFPPIRLGPGQARHPSLGRACSEPRGQYHFVITGRGSHKRNAEAVGLLAQSDYRSQFKITTISVDQDVLDEVERRGLSPQTESYDDCAWSDIEGIYQEATALIALGTSEGFGFSYLEAAACGCPTICPDIAIAHEVLGEQAIYVHAGADARSFDNLLHHRSSWPSTEALQERAASYSWRNSALDVVAMYDNIRASYDAPEDPELPTRRL